MIQKLTLDEILSVLRLTPEQCVFDWKQDLVIETGDKKAEILKDIVAIANATATSPGFVFCGVDPRRPDPVVGTSKSHDDAMFQQMFANKVNPPVVFLYYEATLGPKTVGVFHIPASRQRPHIVMKDFGRLREGQLLIRRGSSTGGMTQTDLFELFYGPTSPYLAGVLEKIGATAMQTQADTMKMRELREQQNSLIRDMEVISGLPPGSLGSR